MANCMAMMGGYNRSYSSFDSGSDNSQLKTEIAQLRLQLSDMKKEMEEMKKLMSAKASFTDFKVFKFNEEEEQKKNDREVVSREQLHRMAQIVRNM